MTLAEQGCVKQEERDTTLLGRGCQARCQPNITPSPSSGTPERLALKLGRNSGAFLEVGRLLFGPLFKEKVMSSISLLIYCTSHSKYLLTTYLGQRALLN